MWIVGKSLSFEPECEVEILALLAVPTDTFLIIMFFCYLILTMDIQRPLSLEGVVVRNKRDEICEALRAASECSLNIVNIVV